MYTLNQRPGIRTQIGFRSVGVHNARGLRSRILDERARIVAVVVVAGEHIAAVGETHGAAAGRGLLLLLLLPGQRPGP